MKREKWNWRGKKGDSYEYDIYELYAIMHIFGSDDVQGNYIFAKVEGDTWKPVYIGQGIVAIQANLEKRNDKNVACIKKNEATHVHVHIKNYDNKTKREAEEEDLIRKWKPPCNDTFK